MKFAVEKEPLLEGLQKVLAVISPRSPIPVLANVLLQAEGEILQLTATDLDLSVRVSVPATVSEPGATTLPAKFIASIFRDAPDARIEVESLTNDSCAIASGSAHFVVRGISADDFPPLPAADGGRSVSLEQKILKTMLQRTGYAASTDESRLILNGELLRFKDGRLTAVATDGRRLALVEQDIELTSEAQLDLVIPSKTITELVRSLGDEGEVRIRSTVSQVLFESEGLVIYSKLLDGAYVNYTQVIPAQSNTHIAVERELFLNAVRRVALMTSEKSNSVKLVFGGNRVEITASSVDIGEARESVPVKYDGEEIGIAFNPNLLIEPLRVLVMDEVYVEISSPTSPGVLKTDEPFLYVIMPLMIS